ncbi:TPA: hypothetical protein G5V04_004067 [Salmonella enterica]|nr:hypothetical protein [Salmonella enterica]
MFLMSVYRKIEDSLCNAYGLNPQDNDLNNLVKCRSVELTKLYLTITKRAEYSFISLSNKDSLAELVYAASNNLIADPLSLSPSLVLHILGDDLYDLEQDWDTQFSEVEQSMREWFADYCERRQRSPSYCAPLPELRWSDLPNELFGLNPKN